MPTKDKKLSIRISETDLARIHRKAEQAKLTLTEYVTRSALQQPVVVIECLRDTLRELKAIGRNLNQLTTLANMGRVQVVNLQQLSGEFAAANEILLERLAGRRSV